MNICGICKEDYGDSKRTSRININCSETSLIKPQPSSQLATITTTSIPPKGEQHNSSLQIISTEMLREYIEKYDGILEHINEWVEHQKQEYADSDYILRSQCLKEEVESFLSCDLANTNSVGEVQRNTITLTLRSYQDLLEQHRAHQEQLNDMLR